MKAFLYKYTLHLEGTAGIREIDEYALVYAPNEEEALKKVYKINGRILADSITCHTVL